MQCSTIYDHYNTNPNQQYFIHETVYCDDEEDQQSMLGPIMLCLGFWATTIGSFAYSYYKIHDYDNLFCQVIDKCIHFRLPVSKPKIMNKQLKDEINNFDTSTLKHLEPYTFVTESDEEYLKQYKLKNTEENQTIVEEKTDVVEEKPTVVEEKTDIVDNLLDTIIENKKVNIEEDKTNLVSSENKSTNYTKLQDKFSQILNHFKSPSKNPFVTNKNAIGKENSGIDINKLGYDLVDSDSSE